jgi:hypothetical protein
MIIANEKLFQNATILLQSVSSRLILLSFPFLHVSFLILVPWYVQHLLKINHKTLKQYAINLYNVFIHPSVLDLCHTLTTKFTTHSMYIHNALQKHTQTNGSVKHEWK